MANYTAPTLADFRARFPEFAAVGDGVVTEVLTEALIEVDTTWIASDYPFAILYLTAHLLVMSGVFSDDQASFLSNGPVISRKAGGSQEIYASSKASSAMFSSSGTDYWRTSYGRRFQQLLRRSSPGVLVV